MNSSERPFTFHPWHLTDSSRVWVGGSDLAARRGVEAALVGLQRPPSGPLDAAFITPSTVEEAAYFAAKLVRRLPSQGRIWVVRSGGDLGPELIDRMQADGWIVAGATQVDPTLRCTAFTRSDAADKA